MKKKLLLSILLLPYFAFSQVRQWTSSYNDAYNGDDIAYAIVTDAAGNSYVTGGIGQSTGPAACGTIKYNSSGVQQWISIYNPGPDVEFGRDLVIDGAGNVYVAGTQNSGTNQDFAVIKYDNSGTEIWSHNFDGGSNLSDEAYSIAVDNSGNVYATGRSTDPSGDVNIGTVKYNSSGAFQWSAFYNGSNDSVDFGSDIKIDISGNIYVLGNTSSATEGMNYVVIKYNSSGTQLWATEVSGTGNYEDIARAMVLDASGNAYVTGTIYTPGEVNNCGTAKINSGGSIVWKAEYQGTATNSDEGYAIALDGSGNVFITGTSVSFFSGFYDVITIKYDNNGNQIWAKEYDGLGHAWDRGDAIAIDASGNVFVTGQTDKPVGAPKKQDYLTIMYDNSGNLQWGDEYDGTASDNDFAFGISIDPSGSAIVTGWSEAAGEGYDIVTIKYCTAPDTAGVISGNNTVCEGDSGVIYSVPASAGASSYTWTLPAGASITSGTGTNTITVLFGSGSTSGTITVQGTNSCSTGNPSPAFAVTVNPAPPTPTITQSGGMLSSNAASGNQWYLNGTLISGATSQNYTPTTPGNYTVIVTDGNGCSSESTVFTVNSIGIAEIAVDLLRGIYPNPSEGKFNISTAAFPTENYEYSVTTLSGKVIQAKFTKYKDKLEIDLGEQAKGIYVLEIRSCEKIYRGKLIRE